MKKKYIIIGAIIFIAIIVFGIYSYSTKSLDLSDKEKDICNLDSDCEYAWFTGGCHTPEYVSNVMSKCQDGSGPCPLEAQHREGVTCTCESNSCITNN